MGLYDYDNQATNPGDYMATNRNYGPNLTGQSTWETNPIYSGIADTADTSSFSDMFKGKSFDNLLKGANLGLGVFGLFDGMKSSRLQRDALKQQMKQSDFNFNAAKHDYEQKAERQRAYKAAAQANGYDMIDYTPTAYKEPGKSADSAKPTVSLPNTSKNPTAQTSVFGSNNLKKK